MTDCDNVRRIDRLLKEDLTVRKLLSTALAASRRMEDKHGDKLWSFADQALVSAANFFALFFVARQTGAADVGYFAVAVSVIVIMIGIQDALITKPFTLKYLDSGQSREGHAGGALFLAGAMALFAGLCTGAIALAIHLASDAHDIALLVGALSFALPFALLREFVRRYLLASISVRELFAFDFLAISGMIALLLLASALHQFHVADAMGAIGISYFLVVMVWLGMRRKRFRLSADGIRRSLASCWSVGKWLLPGRAARELQGYMTHWYSIVMLSASATGVFAASLSILALSNPFIIGMINVMIPRAVRSVKEHGMTGLRNQTLSDTITISIVMLAFTAVIVMFGERITSILFPGEDYAGNGSLLAILAAVTAVASIGSPATIGLMAIGHAKAESKISLLIAALQIVLIPALILVWGLHGAAIAMLIAESSGFLARWVLFSIILHREGASLTGMKTAGPVSSSRKAEGASDHA